MLRQKTRPYYVTHHFKEIGDGGCIKHRIVHLPTPCETLAESALLATCAKRASFRTPTGVYSYLLPEARTEAQGVFQPYFEWYKRRHDDICAACRRDTGARVVILDIRKYYPSIRYELARRAWEDAAKEASLPAPLADLGVRLLDGYRAADAPEAGANAGVLTGPMFSHLVGNLLLRSTDVEMRAQLPGGYFRYVDDIVLVGPRDTVEKARGLLLASLDRLGLEPNPDKGDELAAADWVQQEKLYDDREWVRFVGSMKALVLTKPSLCSELSKRLAGAGIRISPPDYRAIVREGGFVQRFRRLREWYVRKLSGVTPLSLADDARKLGDRYQGDLEEWLAEYSIATSRFRRKQVVHVLRSLSWRLVYVAQPDRLASIADSLSAIEEMRVYGEVFRALHRRDVGDLLPYGPNAARAAAQPLATMDVAVSATGRTVPLAASSGDEHDEAVAQSLAVLKLSGVRFRDPEPTLPVGSPLAVFTDTVDAGRLAGHPESYAREIACLRGGRSQVEITDLLRSPFDVRGGMIFDAQGLADAAYW